MATGGERRRVSREFSDFRSGPHRGGGLWRALSGFVRFFPVLRVPGLRVGTAVLAMGALVAVLIGSSAVDVSAQGLSGRPAATSPAAASSVGRSADLQAMPVEQLRGEAEKAVALYVEILADRAPLMDEYRGLEAVVARLAVQRQGLELPAKPAMDHPPAELGEAEALRDQWGRRQDAAERIRATLTERLARLDEYRSLALRLAQDTTLLADAAGGAIPLVREVDRRRIAGEIEAEIAEALTGAIPRGTSVEALLAEVEDWRKLARRAAFEIENAEADRDRTAEAVAEDQGGVARAQRWLQEAVARDNLRQSYAEISTGDLIARFRQEVSDFDLVYAEVSQDLGTLTAHRRRIDGALARIEAQTPPEVGNDGESSQSVIAQLARAQRAVDLGETVVAYYRERLQSFIDLRQLLGEAGEDIAGLRDGVAPTLEQSLSLAVLAGLLQERAQAEGADLIEEADSAIYAGRLDRLREARGELAAFEAQLTALGEEVGGRIDEARVSLLDARGALSRHRRTLASEQEWAAFVDELRELDAENLIRTFDETASAYRDRRGQLSRVGREADRLLAGIEEVEATLSAHVDPTLLGMREREAAFSEWVSGQRLVIEEPPSAEETAPAVEPTEPGQTEPAPAAEPAEPEPSQAEQWLEQLRTLRDGFVIRRQTFYEEHRDLRHELRETLSGARGQFVEFETQAQEVLDDARRAWGAAVILNARVRRGDLAEGDLPQGTGDWNDREALEAARRVVNDMATARARIEERVAELDQLEGLDGLIAPLSAWQENLNAKAEELSDYINFQTQFETVADLDSMNPVDRQIMTDEINARIAADLGVYDVLDNFFASAETETIDEILTRYYERLVISERRLENIETRRQTLEALVADTQENRPTFEALREQLVAVVDAADRALQIETALVQAALDPDNAADILAAVGERVDREITAADVPELPVDADDETMRKRRNALVAGLNEHWARAFGYRAWLQDVEATLEPLGGMDQEVEQYLDLSSRLAATGTDVTRTIGRLIGYSPKELQQLAFDDPSTSSDRLSAGEIGTLQLQRQERVNTNAIQSLTALVVIPVVALLFIVLLRLMGRRYVNNAGKKPGADPGARPRAETLNGVAQTTLTTLIVIIAVIYMLRSVNFDVAPLLASLGFIGLAVAFGAQNMMKDLFSGLFLLLENQFNAGEWVVVNGDVVGQVESVGLRMTTFRDWTNGTMHYIPNGQIDRISNYNREWNRRMVWIRVPFETDVDLVRRLLNEAIEELKEHETFGPVFHASFLHPGIGDFDYEVGALVFRVNLDAREVRASGTANTYLNIVKRKFDEHGVPLAITKRKVVAEGEEDDGTSALGKPEFIEAPAAAT